MRRAPALALTAITALLATACSSETGGRDGDRRTPTPSPAAPSSAAAGPKGKAVVATSDFNGDGYGDLVVPAPWTAASGREQAGAVVVVYGGEDGIDLRRRRQTLVAVGGTSVPARLKPLLDQGHRFGEHVTAADLDGDGNTDLVASLDIGSTDDERAGESAEGDHEPGRDEQQAGPVTLVLWGSRIGLEEVTVLPSLGETATGDFDGDGHADLVTGGTRLLYGPFGRDGRQRKSGRIEGNWGDSGSPRHVVVGDLNGDGRDDLVTSQGFEEMSYPDRFHPGGKDGLRAKGRDVTSYGLAAAVGDFDCDGFADLASYDIGAVSEDSVDSAGRVRVLSGGPKGPGGSAVFLTAPGGGRAGDHTPGATNQGDQFGAALGAGDGDGDGCADLAVGAPGTDDAAGHTDAGAVYVFKGMRGRGLGATPARTYTQDSAGVPGNGERGDLFGSAVSFRAATKGAPADLAVGAAGEDGTRSDSGAVWVLPGGPTGPIAEHVVSFGPAAVHAPETGEPATDPGSRSGTGFGATLR
ncbi:FG-GAP-like repeat-containing protein [Streptomyces sp. KL116D]|uniref:FG-GAP-like repeat-containing protein n=1 Tax=Streptomyces sp. KL116D TaxID=3045152 RepID=UPI00355837B7